MVALVTVVAVGHEGVATGLVGSAEIDGTRVGYLVVDHGIPLYLIDAFAVFVMVFYRLAKAEILRQRIGYLVGVSS